MHTAMRTSHIIAIQSIMNYAEARSLLVMQSHVLLHAPCAFLSTCSKTVKDAKANSWSPPNFVLGMGEEGHKHRIRVCSDRLLACQDELTLSACCP